MNKTVRVSCVSYINSAPFQYGLTHHPITEQIQLTLDSPAECAARLINGTADIGLVPVAAIENIKGAEIISGWCIGADGPVKSVTLLSHVPIEEIDNILLDYQSRTSVKLARILSREYWKIAPTWTQSEPGYESQIKGKTAAVVIGDRSLQLRDEFEYVYDLSGEWKKFTGLPFVFACWITNTALSKNFLENFEDALTSGVNNIEIVISEIESRKQVYPETGDYLRNYLSYKLDGEKRKGMELFLKYASRLDLE